MRSNFIKNLSASGHIPVVKGKDLQPRGHGFETWHLILDGIVEKNNDKAHQNNIKEMSIKKERNFTVRMNSVTLKKIIFSQIKIHQ